MIAKQAQAGGIMLRIARPARVLAILVALVVPMWSQFGGYSSTPAQSPGGERNDAKRNERVGDSPAVSWTLTPADPSFCVGSTCSLADMLDDSSLTVDTLTLAELDRLNSARYRVAQAREAQDTVVADITAAHGAHTHSSLIGGCIVHNLQNGISPAPTIVPSLPVDDSWMDVIVVLRGKYAFRVKRIPPSMCSIGWGSTPEPTPVNQLPVTY